MWKLNWVCIAVVLVLLAATAQAGPARIVKVLPQYLDREGRVALSPSLFERDAYQAFLRAHPDRRGGLRFAVQWKGSASGPLTLRVELRGLRDNRPTVALLEAPVPRSGSFSRWATAALTGADYEAFGQLRAWRVTLWKGSTLLSEQRSFLWDQPNPKSSWRREGDSNSRWGISPLTLSRRAL